MPMMMVDLKGEAAAEACRAARARAWSRGEDAHALSRLESSGVWIARTRSNRTRQLLRGRFALVWRIVLEDAAGRAMESGLVAIAVDVAREARRGLTPAMLETLVSALEREARPCVELATAEWRLDAERTALRFASTRIARERAIAAAMSASAAENGAYQPGLFDRRVDRERRSHAAATSNRRRPRRTPVVGRALQRLARAPGCCALVP